MIGVTVLTSMDEEDLKRLQGKCDAGSPSRQPRPAGEKAGFETGLSPSAQESRLAPSSLLAGVFCW